MFQRFVLWVVFLCTLMMGCSRTEKSDAAISDTGEVEILNLAGEVLDTDELEDQLPELDNTTLSQEVIQNSNTGFEKNTTTTS